MQVAAQFQGEKRERLGKGGARAARRADKIPAVLYSAKSEPVHFAVSEKDVRLEYLKGGFFNKIIAIEVGKEKYHALPKDVQLHPVSDKIEHADFMRVEEKEEIRVLVPVKFLNPEKSPGLKRGGVLNVVRHDLELVCKPADIPALIEINLEGTEIGDSIHISKVALPKGVRPSIARDFTVCTIAGRMKSIEEEIAAQEAAAAAAAAEAAVAEGAEGAAPGAAPAAPGAAPAAPGAAPAAGGDKEKKDTGKK